MPLSNGSRIRSLMLAVAAGAIGLYFDGTVHGFGGWPVGAPALEPNPVVPEPVIEPEVINPNPEAEIPPILVNPDVNEEEPEPTGNTNGGPDTPPGPPDLASAPEPGTLALALLGVGVAALAHSRRRRK